MRVVALLLSLLIAVAPAAAQTNLRKPLYAGTARRLNYPIKWGFSCEFPKDENLRSQVREGFEYWDSLTRVHLFEEVKTCGEPKPEHGILVIPVRQKYVDKNEIVDGTAYVYPEWGQQLGGAIALWDDWFTNKYADVRRSIVRHEIGHVLGFGHNDTRENCLMHPYVNTERYRYHHHEKNVCQSELSEFRRLFGN